MIIQVQSYSVQQQHSAVVSLRCPGCRQQGTFDVLVNVADATLMGPPNAIVSGQRRCPNPTCRAHIFILFSPSQNVVLASYPAERIDFDTTNIPPTVVSALEEAITCHANQSFVAAAIMVRKTLEELCRDRDAKGDSLKARIKALGSKIVLPKDLLEGLDDLRLLGNDAAHIESTEDNKVGGRSRDWYRVHSGGAQSCLPILDAAHTPQESQEGMIHKKSSTLESNGGES